ncbi:N-terminal EF-hand calcium-binding protein 1 [Pteropus vampyrus]|uniref:N-terminal EF-hand calcium-binding protein 1 n=1 Tax=Pteropus vampyrus TaxID=132908 RepID=A0A6P6BS75_PTEVA|nr:N-terminal EF-hand calcium-binding protein 1 [Pteropus vampyrus]
MADDVPVGSVAVGLEGESLYRLGTGEEGSGQSQKKAATRLPAVSAATGLLELVRGCQHRSQGAALRPRRKAGVFGGSSEQPMRVREGADCACLMAQRAREYFSQHLGEYENVLAALEDLNLSILKAMSKTKKDYQEASSLEQFVTRFLLKETLSQLQSLQNSLECAMETTEEQTRQERRGPSTPEVLSTQRPGRRSGRRVQRFGGFSPGGPQLVASSPGFLEEDSRWATQIDRLQRLIDRLEKKDLKLEPLEEEVIEGNTKSHILLVQRQMAVVEEDARDFQLALKHYADGAAAQSGCLRISIQKLSNESRYMIYEFWENSNLWNSHLQTNYSKTFQRSNVDFLETPELTSTMLVPASWWILNNN